MFVFVCDMGVSGLWIGMALGIYVQGIFYTLLVFKTDWQDVADKAAKRISNE